MRGFSARVECRMGFFEVEIFVPGDAGGRGEYNTGFYSRIG